MRGTQRRLHRQSARRSAKQAHTHARARIHARTHLFTITVTSLFLSVLLSMFFPLSVLCMRGFWSITTTQLQTLHYLHCSTHQVSRRRILNLLLLFFLHLSSICSTHLKRSHQRKRLSKVIYQPENIHQPHLSVHRDGKIPENVKDLYGVSAYCRFWWCGLRGSNS